jgi:transcriptional regulatory protein RtcR
MRVGECAALRLADVLAVCLQHRTAAEAARVVFDVSSVGVEARRHSQPLRKYLARFGLEFGEVKHRAP